ncbi:MAG: GntR family transcriptional regulator [Clostridium sp.]|nr:GntR family transcriptional regulator [Clostridium sp.]
MNDIIKDSEENYEKSMREIVLQQLRKDIFTRVVKPGDRLIETAIASKLGVSRTPVREALRQLESEGLAVNIPRKGTIVKGICYEDAAEIYDIREVLEGLAVRSACLNISRMQIRRLKEITQFMRKLIDSGNEETYVKVHDEYNKIILEASNNKRLLAQLESIHEYLKSLRLVSLMTKERKELALKEHLDIVMAIEEGDENKAEIIARNHVRNAKKSFEDSLKN